MAQQKHEPVQKQERVLYSVRPQEWGWSGMAGYELVQPEGIAPIVSLYHVTATEHNFNRKLSATSFIDAAEKGAKRFIIAQSDLFDIKSVSLLVREDNAALHTAQQFRVHVSSVKLSVDVNVVAVKAKSEGE